MDVTITVDVTAGGWQHNTGLVTEFNLPWISQKKIVRQGKQSTYCK
jgi:hypothetical protein